VDHAPELVSPQRRIAALTHTPSAKPWRSGLRQRRWVKLLRLFMTPIRDIHAEDIRAAHYLYASMPTKLNGVKLYMKDGSVNLYENNDLTLALVVTRERFGRRKPEQPRH
jgi:hypothetical protein